jgi:hypothetical protein
MKYTLGRFGAKLRLETRLLKEMPSLDVRLRNDLIRQMSRISGRGNGGSEEFWKKVAEIVQAKNKDLTAANCVGVFVALASVGQFGKGLEKVRVRNYGRLSFRCWSSI